MKFHREGSKIIMGTTLVLVILNVGLSYLSIPAWLTSIIAGVSIVLLVLVLQFFRNPSFDPVIDENAIICPADGKVVVIEEIEETEYFKDKRIQISIFMSPFNVHVNRNPIGGTVSYDKYHPGKYLVAWHPKSSTENERTTFVIKANNGQEVLFRQIAGAVARRIRWYIKTGMSVEQTAEMGFIKFGSRVDVFVPLGTKIDVKIGDKVKGGRTKLATFA